MAAATEPRMRDGGSREIIISDWHGPVHWESREIAVGPITNHSSRESRVVEETLAPSLVDHRACNDEVAHISHIQFPTSPDLPQEAHKKSDHRADQCSEQQ